MLVFSQKMKSRYLPVLFLALLCAAQIAEAQTATVTITATDVNGISYTGATVKAQLVLTSGTPVSGQPTMTVSSQAQCVSGGFGSAPCQMPFPGTVGPTGPLTAAGIPMTLQFNSGVTPASTQWLVTVNSTGTPPPLGTGPQVCTLQTTITSGQTALALTGCPALSNVGSGAVNNNVNPTVPTSLCPGCTAKWDVKYVYDSQSAVCATAPCTVTFPNNDGNWTSSDVGKIEFGTSAPASVGGLCSGTACGQVTIAQGTITSVGGAQTISVSVTIATACTPSSSGICGFAAGTQDDSSAMNAAATAAWITPGGKCLAVEMPSGNAFFSGPIFGVNGNSTAGNACKFQSSSNQTGADTNSNGPVLKGQGTTTLIPLPTFNFTPVYGSAIIGGVPGLQMHDFAVDGLGQALNGVSSTFNIIEFDVISPACTQAIGWNIYVSNWALDDPNATGISFNMGCNDPVAWNMNVLLAGGTNCSVSNSLIFTVFGLMCYGSGVNPNLSLSGSGATNTYGGYFSDPIGATGGIPSVLMTGNGGGTWNSYGDQINIRFQTAFTQTVQFTSGTLPYTANFYGTQAHFSASGNAGAHLFYLNGASGSKATFHGGAYGTAGANNNLFTTSAGNTVVDACGNTWLNGGAANSFSGPVINCPTAQTGTAPASSNITLGAGYGTSSVASFNGSDAKHFNFTLTLAGTLTLATETITYTFPSNTFPLTAAGSCRATVIGGTQFAAAAYSFLTTTLPTTSSVVFTQQTAAGTAGNTEIIAVDCQ